MAKLLILQVVHLLLMLLLIQVLHTCVCDATMISNNQKSKNTTHPSSCGNLTKVSHPFRLKTDPINCGLEAYEICCENNIPVMYALSHKYYVRSIDYHKSTIRLSDAFLISLTTNHSLFCGRSLTRYLLAHNWNEICNHFWCRNHQSLVIINCPSPLPNSNDNYYYHLVDAPPCNKTNNDLFSSDRKYVYARFGETLVEDLVDSCRVELNLPISIPLSVLLANRTIISYEDVYESLAYGFELTWYAPDFVRDLFILISRSTLALLVSYHALIFIIGTPCIAIFLTCKWRRRHLSMFQNIEEFLQSFNQLMPVRYSYADIKKITKGFKEKLGEGGYGCVYKAKLRSGLFAAVKILGKAETDGKDFMNEVATIGRIHHHNIVRLIGFCADGSKRALVYEYMPNGSLNRFIMSREEQCDNIPTISNKKLYDISLGVARGIEYLHRGCDMQILHFDLKPHNILLDENFTPKISDFGLAKLNPTDKSFVSLTAARGTLGYMAPELVYRSVGGISFKADVYSFGRMLMEMAGRKRHLNSSSSEHSSQIFFPSWVHDQISEGKDIDLEDGTDVDKEIIKKMILVGLWCVQLNPDDRPSMRKVVQMLEGGVECLQLPPKPLFGPQVTMFTEDSSATMTGTSYPTFSRFTDGAEYTTSMVINEN